MACVDISSEPGGGGSAGGGGGVQGRGTADQDRRQVQGRAEGWRRARRREGGRAGQEVNSPPLGICQSRKNHSSSPTGNQAYVGPHIAAKGLDLVTACGPWAQVSSLQG